VKSKLNTTQALERIEAELSGSPAVTELVTFIRESKRGFHNDRARTRRSSRAVVRRRGISDFREVK
jgi:hypothetical protein